METLISKHVIVRGNASGVFFGVLESRSGKDVSLTSARKIWKWVGACGVEQIAVNGLSNLGDNQLTIEVESMIITDAIQVILCTEEAIEKLKLVPVWKI